MEGLSPIITALNFLPATGSTVRPGTGVTSDLILEGSSGVAVRSGVDCVKLEADKLELCCCQHRREKKACCRRAGENTRGGTEKEARGARKGKGGLERGLTSKGLR